MRSWLAACLALVATGATAEPRPATGGVGLFAALESSPIALLATVSEPRALDGDSWVAKATPQVVFRGESLVGQGVEIAWEELSQPRPVRFEAGGSVLLALERLPGASIWRQRIADPARLARTLTVAARGGAFVRSPSSGEVRLVEHFLALPADLRDANPGVAHLVKLAAEAQPVLAAAAIERLGGVAELDAALDQVTSARMVAVLLRDPPELGEALLALVERERPSKLRVALAERAPPDGLGPARLYRALGALDDGLDPARVSALWGRSDSARHRSVAARYAAASDRERLRRSLRADASAAVRAAAATRLAELDGTGSLDPLLFALGDADLEVRFAALEAVAGFGAEAVPGLRKTAESGTLEAARTAVGALRAVGPAGARALQELAATHPDESVRTLARAALGGAIGHTH